MPANVAAVLEPLGEARVALESVAVQARLRGLLSETQVTQTYRNLEDDNIEAVYTFPLPLDAVLLELELTLNGRSLQGQIQAKAQAEESYEDAIDEGDSAVLLQAAGPGLYSLNVGNLMPGETAVVCFRYAQLHRWQGDSLRFHLPTTIAPRYGDPAVAGLAPHQVPEHVLTADHGFTLSVRLEGSHADADFECPSHTVAVAAVDAGREIRLSGGASIMDRDFVLVLRETGAAPEGLWAQNEEGVVALASFHPRFPADTPKPRRRVTLVVDCSGSMGGDSIAQARAALEEILALLEPGDRFNLVAFGSSHRALFSEPVMADAEHIREATRFAGQLDARMGGTEIGAALDAAYRGGPSDVLLITDGEVWNDTDVVGRAERSGKRIFTVGVGSSVAEAFVRELAERTGGACELVSPREDMAERIVRHFRRMDQPRAVRAGVEWSAAARRQVPESIDAVYGGDTLHLLAWLAEPPSDHATLTLTLEGGRELREQVAFTPTAGTDQEDADVLPRVAARRRLRDLQQDEATDLAVRYQLVTEHTSCVLVYAREVDAKAEKVPALRKVPQVLAAGWGGTGSMRAADLELSAVQCLRSETLSAPDLSDVSFGSVHGDAVDYQLADSFEDLEEPDLAKAAKEPSPPPHTDLTAIVAALNARFPDDRAANLDLRTLRDLASLGFRTDVIEVLTDLVDDDCPEETVVAAVLSAVASSPAGKRLSRNARRLIRRAERAWSPSGSLVKKISLYVRGAEPKGLFSKWFGS
jgi:Ca-activated chloride channel family protein